MRKTPAARIALGGMLAAVALVIMCLGGLIPLATFICPMLATLTGFLAFRFCGKKIAWCWYFAVAVLSLLMSPDKEAAMIFLFLVKHMVKQSLVATICFGFRLMPLVVVICWIICHFVHCANMTTHIVH